MSDASIAAKPLVVTKNNRPSKWPIVGCLPLLIEELERAVLMVHRVLQVVLVLVALGPGVLLVVLLAGLGPL
jgi:hypothetical protein